LKYGINSISTVSSRTRNIYIGLDYDDQAATWVWGNNVVHPEPENGITYDWTPNFPVMGHVCARFPAGSTLLASANAMDCSSPGVALCYRPFP